MAMPLTETKEVDDTPSKLHQQTATPPVPSSTWDSLKSLSFSNQFKRLTEGKIPCERNSLLLGIGTGAAVFAVGLVARRGLKSSSNWGVGAGVFVTLASFETCRSARKAEAKRMKVIVEDFQRKRGTGADISQIGNK